MSASYRAVNWNRFKRRYDLAFLSLLVIYAATFVAVALLAHPESTAETVMIRTLGTAALLFLHITLSIGPLSRLSPRFLPLLYNRRHLGVLTFCIALLHAALSLFQFHAGGDVNPFVSLLVSNTRYDSLSQFPFEILGIGALLILALMAVTSHDFWLANLSPRAWKSIHMLVYPAYVLVVMHVALGALQDSRTPALAIALSAGATWLAVIHILAGAKAAILDRRRSDETGDHLIAVGEVSEFSPGCARLAHTPDGGIAVFRYGGNGEWLAAMSNVCAHQGGPLAEGRIVDGCVTCPWHGYQYRPESGGSPPPYDEVLPTYQVTLRGNQVLVDPAARPLDAPATPVRLDVGRER